MLPSRAKRLVRRIGGLSVVAAFAAAPKCLLCLAAYAGLGTLIGIKVGSPELCGLPSRGFDWGAYLLPLLGLISAAVLWLLRRRRRAVAASFAPPRKSYV